MMVESTRNPQTRAQMPKSTIALLGVYLTLVGVLVLALWDRPSLSVRRQYGLINVVAVLAVLGFLSVWSVLTPGARRRRLALLAAGTVVLPFAVLLTENHFRFDDFLGLSACLAALAVGSCLSAGYFAVKRFRIFRTASAPEQAVAAPLRFSLREMFLLTLLCAVLLTMRQLLGVEWDSLEPVLPIALILTTFGLVSAAACWAMLMPPRPSLRIPIGLTACTVPWLVYVYNHHIHSRNTDASEYFAVFLVGYYAASLPLYATLRWSGYRLLQFTRHDETAAANHPTSP